MQWQCIAVVPTTSFYGFKSVGVLKSMHRLTSPIRARHASHGLDGRVGALISAPFQVWRWEYLDVHEAYYGLPLHDRFYSPY